MIPTSLEDVLKYMTINAIDPRLQDTFRGKLRQEWGLKGLSVTDIAG